MDSIMNAEEDQTGSRAARLRLINQGIQVFLENPITGIGAGQFQNYNAPGVVEKWRVTHNVWLQVAAEIGVFGLMTFAFLVVRAFAANLAARRLLRSPRRRRTHADGGLRYAARGTPDGEDAAAGIPPSSLNDADRAILDTHAKSMIAAMVGWTICSLFASVAFNWTFYYVLALSVAGREVLAARRAAAREAAAPAPAPAARLVRAHA
jgi:O-antigen ligase